MVVVKKAMSFINNLSCPKTPRQYFPILIYVLGLACALWIVMQLLHGAYEATYIWQVTTVGDFLLPSTRTGCDILNFQSKLAPEPVSKLIVPPTNSQKNSNLRIGLLMLYSDKDGTWDEALMLRVLKNREKYSRKYGYKIVVANDALDKTRPAAWSKLRAMDQHLDEFDYLVYIDMDVVIMNMDISMESFINLNRQKDFIMAEDWSGPNTGVWIAKKSKWTHWFLQTAWNQTELVPSATKDGKVYPFLYEQRAFHYMLQTSMWRHRHLPLWKGDVREIRSHFLFLPQCAMNSYIVYPFYHTVDRKQSHYVPGDFLVHFAGKKGVIKSNLMSHYLTLAEEQQNQ